jgi:hypothetical protein
MGAPKRRLVHLLYIASLIGRRKDQRQAVDLIGSNPAAVILFKQVPQPLVFEALDHRPAVKRQLTFVNTKQSAECGNPTNKRVN